MGTQTIESAGMIPSEDNPVCIKCGLYKGCRHPFMDSSGSDHPSVLVVGEAPGCITGDTLIDTAFRDKSVHPYGIPIQDLVGQSGFYVYSYDKPNEQLVLGKVNRVWKTGSKGVYRVTYEWKYAHHNRIEILQSHIDVTSNHKFLLKAYIPHDPFAGSQRFVGAPNSIPAYASINDGLVEGWSIQPFIRNNYERAYVGSSAKATYIEARFLLEWKLGRLLGNLEQCHHIDRNKLNDSYDNLEMLDIVEHATRHMQEDGNCMSDPLVKAKHAKAMQDPTYKQKQSDIMKDILADPAQHKARLEQIQFTNPARSNTVKALFNDPSYYLNYLMGKQRQHNLSDEWLAERFKAKFPDYDIAEDNHKVISIEFIGIEDVYDMEVEEYHNFAANGIFVHNSEEDQAGVPFVGQSGQLLRQVLSEFFDLDNDVRFTNIVRCRPPENKITKKAILACRDFVMGEIQVYNPQFVFLMGNSPLSGVLGESGISQWNGVMIPKVVVDDFQTMFVPLYHPAYILRDVSHTDEWIDAIAKAVSGGGAKSGEEPGISASYPMTIDEVHEMQVYLDQYEELSYDTETHHMGNALDAFGDDSAILSVSFAAGDRSYALPVFHPEAPWTDSELTEIVKVITDILSSHCGSVIGHNLKFDMIWTAKNFGYWIEPGGDSMLLDHMLDSRPGQGIHGLKRLAGLHLNMYDYNSELEDYKHVHREANVGTGGSYAYVPWTILAPYGANDAKATLLLHDMLYEKLTETQRNLYHELVIPATGALARMQYNGFTVDQKIAKRYLSVYKTARKKAYTELLKDRKVQKLIKYYQDTLVGKASQKYQFNPGSSQQLCYLLFDLYKIPPVYETDPNTGKPKKNPTTKSDVYKPLEERFPILSQVRYYKLLTKMISTYLLPATTSQWLSDDGKVHTNFNQTGTVTSRTSSSDPVNLQNIPTKEKEPGTLLETMPIKNIFTHSNWIDEYGQDVFAEQFSGDDFDYGALVAADFSGIELRVFASIANCETMLKIIESGLDTHKMVAAVSKRLISQDDLEDAANHIDEIQPILDTITKEVRYVYKWTSWTLLYGGDEYTLSHLYDIPLEEAKKTVKIYYEVFPEVLDQLEKCAQFASENGYIESPFGRREYLPYINDRDEKMANRSKREAVNMPMQATASDLTIASIVILDKEIQRRQMYARLCSEVHDSIVGDAPRGEIITYALLVKDVMENIKKYAKIEMPHIDFSWLRCSLKADIEVGTHYGSTIDLDDWIKEYGNAYDQTCKETYHSGLTKAR